ncbi:hypothetical protein ACC733_37865, partial [Rhizobium johnstonii]|uniref:hypothetical protein n=1 Tax=Rhizobium johnstonii TaxID=3019933 RepID=UPI003F9B9116
VGQMFLVALLPVLSIICTTQVLQRINLYVSSNFMPALESTCTPKRLCRRIPLRSLSRFCEKLVSKIHSNFRIFLMLLRLS